MRRRAAFTLIEMLAVVTIFALLATFTIPALSSLSGRALHEEAERLAGQIDLARQRSVMTGVPHRVLFDLDNSAYRMEWLMAEDGAADEPAPSEPPTYDVSGGTPLDLSAPRRGERSYRPVPGLLGRFVALDEDVEFARLEVEGTWVESGESFVAFERDGTARRTSILLDDESANVRHLDVLPLADAVQIYDETL